MGDLLGDTEAPEAGMQEPLPYVGIVHTPPYSSNGGMVTFFGLSIFALLFATVLAQSDDDGSFSATPSPSPSNTTGIIHHDTSSGLSKGATAGIGIAFATLVICGIVAACRKCCGSSEQETTTSTTVWNPWGATRAPTSADAADRMNRGACYDSAVAHGYKGSRPS